MEARDEKSIQQEIARGLAPPEARAFPRCREREEPIQEPGETALSPDSIPEEPDSERSIADAGPDGIQGEIAEGVPSEPAGGRARHNDPIETEPDPALRKSDT
jgi:hypothetical protein